MSAGKLRRGVEKSRGLGIEYENKVANFRFACVASQRFLWKKRSNQRFGQRDLVRDSDYGGMLFKEILRDLSRAGKNEQAHNNKYWSQHRLERRDWEAQNRSHKHGIRGRDDGNARRVGDSLSEIKMITDLIIIAICIWVCVRLIKGLRDL